MGLSGKYNFPGIKKAGAAGLSAVLASTSVGGWLIKFGGGKIMDIILEWCANWLANKGLILLNIGAIIVNGELDQKALDSAIDEGILQVRAGNLTPEQGKAIDDKVRQAADRALPYNGPK